MVENELMNNEDKEIGNCSIWIINHYAHTPDLPGGSRHYDIGRRLVERGYRVSVFCSDFLHYVYRYHKTRVNKKKFFQETVEGMEWNWIRTSSYKGNTGKRVLNMISFTWRVLWIGLRKKERPRVIIGSSPHLFAAFSAWLLARWKRAKFIFEVRDLWPQSLIDLGEFSPSHPFIRLLARLEKFLYYRADAIVTLLPGAKEYIKNRGVKEDKVFWIPNGVDVDNFTSSNSLFMQSRNDQFLVMYAGAHGKANALDMIIDAAALILEQRVDGIFFEFVGEGPEKKNLITMVKEKKINNVRFADPIPSSEIPVKLSNADALVFCLEDSPLYKYGISLNKMFVYLASGKPILLSGNPLNNPIQEAGAGISVPPRNPKALAQAVIKLFKMSPQEREEMGKRGREYVKKYHDFTILTDKYQEVIENVTV
jgi:glycosyltransferase involved in cell wall biosynthesis